MEEFLAGVPIEKCRGIEIADTVDSMIIVQASVESVAESFRLLRPVNAWEHDVYNREIEVPDSGVLVFQLVGHSWSIVHGFYSLPRKENPYPFYVSIGEQQASLLSSLLQTKVIGYSISDTGSYINYHLFDSGNSIERFYYTAASNTSVNDENWPGTYQFQSCLRHLAKEDIGYPIRFVDQFLREQDIYIPYLPFFWYKFHSGEKVTLRRIAEKNLKFKRVDCLSVST